MQTRAIYSKPVQFPPSSTNTAALTSTKSISYDYCTLQHDLKVVFLSPNFGLLSLLLPVRCFLCVRWILLVICMHCTVSCSPYPSIFLSLMNLLLGLYYSLLSLHYMLRRVELLDQRMHWNSSLCPSRSSNLQSPPPSSFSKAILFQ